MLRRFAAAPLALALLLVVQSSLFAQSPLDAVGTDAAGVVRLKSPKATTEKLVAMVDAAKQGMGFMVQGQAGAIGMLISNPTLDGVDMAQDWYVAVYAPEEGGSPEPGVVFIVPATDLEKMKKAVESDFQFFESGKFGVYTAKGSSTADKVAKRLKGEGKSIATLSDKDSTALFAKGDVSIFLNLKQVIKTHQGHLDQVLQSARQEINNIPAQADAGPFGGINPEEIAKMATKVLDLSEQAMKEVESCTIIANFSKDGVAFEDVLKFTANGSAAKYLTKHKPSDLALIANLPESSVGFFGASIDIPELMNFGVTMLQANKGTKDLADALKQASSIKYGSTVASFGLGNLTEGLIRSTTVAETSEPQKVRELTKKLIGSIGSIEQGGGIKQKYEYEADAEAIGKTKVDITKVEMEIDPNEPMAAFVVQYLTMIYGPEGMTTRTAYMKDRVVSTFGGGQEGMEKSLASLSGTPQSKTPAMTTRAALGGKVNILGMVDLPGAVGKLVTAVAESDIGKMFLPLDEDTIKALELPPSFSGLSLTVEPATIRVRTVVPIEQIRGAVTLAELFEKVRSGQLGQVE